jgi:hypothetical protein
VRRPKHCYRIVNFLHRVEGGHNRINLSHVETRLCVRRDLLYRRTCQVENRRELIP